MNNEELAIEIQNGNKSACAKPWEQVKHFIKKSAFGYYNALRSSDREYVPDEDDFISDGYIAMFEAVKYYTLDNGYRYITYVNKTLKKAFAAVVGRRTLRTQNEPLNDCRTLNLPVGTESEDMEFIDMLSDETAENEFERVELFETQQLIADILAELRECDRHLIKMRFWSELFYDYIGSAFSIANSAAIAREKRMQGIAI